jgi:hypothetical protein
VIYKTVNGEMEKYPSEKEDYPVSNATVPDGKLVKGFGTINLAVSNTKV